MIRNKILPLAVCSLLLVQMFFMHSCANTTQAPSGGPKDTIPPALLSVRPYPGSTDVPTSGVKMHFTFDEYVKIKTATNILLSPPSKKAPKSKISGKDVVVWFEEPLQEGITYTINFTGAIVDNNEGNLFPGYTFPFSTGKQIDSMLITGEVLDCSSLAPVKEITVMLYKDHADSAVFLHRPDAVCKTDEWGFFCMPYVKDTLYRIYAIQDENNNYMYDPATEKIAFLDTLIRPLRMVSDTIPEMQFFDVKDTLGCQSRKADYSLSLFKEKSNALQGIKNYGRTSARRAFVSFSAEDTWIDSLWIAGLPANKIITQFNREMDSLEIWVNDRRRMPDTLHLFINYRKTDSTGALSPAHEHIKLFEENKKRVVSRKDIKHDDTTCVFKLEAKPEIVEQEGLTLSFTYPIITQKFDSIKFTYINPKQKELAGKFKIERDTLDLRNYKITPDLKLQPGFEYIFNVPHRAFRDINGFYSDSLKVKFKLPDDDALSTLLLDMKNVDRNIIVELLDEKKSSVKRQYVINSDTVLQFPYLSEGKYAIRVTEDSNCNSMVDTGDLLLHRMPEKVRFFKDSMDKDVIQIMSNAEVTQTIDLKELFK